MSVTFNRVQLIAVTNRALRAHDEAKKSYQKQVDAFLHEHALDGIRTSHRVGLRMRNELTRQLRGHKPITHESIEKLLNGANLRGAFYTPPDSYAIKREMEKQGLPTGYMSPAEITEAKALLAVLNAAAGDTISANELKLLGLKNLAPVFTAAARAS